MLQPSARVVKQVRFKDRLDRQSRELAGLKEELSRKTEELERLNALRTVLFVSPAAENLSQQIESLSKEREELAGRVASLTRELETLGVMREELMAQGEATVDLIGVPGGVFPTEPAGYMLSRPGLLILAATLFLSLWFKQVAIAMLVALAVSAAGLAKFWSRFSLIPHHCLRRLSEKRAFPGESIELRLKVTNRKILPLPWLQVEDEAPLALAEGIPSLVAKNDSYVISSAAMVGWYSSISWRYQLHCRKRGYYQLGPVTLTSGDIIGFYPRSEYRREIDHVIVYPKLYPVGDLYLPSVQPMGEAKAPRYIFEDPTRPIGVRDYSYQDSLKYIHWKASARHQQLKVKVFEPTTTLKVVFFLAVESFAVDGEDDFELGISAAASLARYLIEHRSAAGLFVNSPLVDGSGPVRLLPGGDKAHLVGLLEGLAKVTHFPTLPFAEFLQDEQAGLPWGTTIVLILAEVGEDLAQLLTSLRKKGHKILVLQVGNAPDSGVRAGVPLCRVRHPDDLTSLEFKEIA
ncbi:MAG: DUF58 domain-containing protein [Chloroflexota bacterium]